MEELKNAKVFLAHISEDGRKQLLIDHLKGTADLASRFASSFGQGEYAYYIGLYHDIGKYSKEFQYRLRGGPKVDHSTAGAYIAFQNRMSEAAFCIAGHHSGLPDAGSRTDAEGTTMLARMNRAADGKIPDFSEWKNEVHESFAKQKTQCSRYSAFFRTQMLYSCLVDADFLDTERFMQGEMKRSVKTSFKELEGKLHQYIEPWYESTSELNVSRCEILSRAIQKGRENDQGLYTLTVPTGGGKTVTSLAFAINHAIRNHLDRIIYVIPYTSIIEQTAEVFRRILGDENVLEHHSGVEYGEDEDSLFYMRVTENWDMPVVVTTAVQFFESIYRNTSSPSRKVHNIANSVIIFDEAQMMPVPFLKPCLRSIAELVEYYNSTAVMCTATQPALQPYFEEYLPDHSRIEICSEELSRNSVFDRVKYENMGSISKDDLVETLNQHEQVLCIVNSRKLAKELYSDLNTEGIFHLSTFMYPVHRKKVLSDIRERLKSGDTCKVISTSLIEAGVDVDFPVVYRQLAGLDSILQAGGRCNREGKRNRDDSHVYVFKVIDRPSPDIFSVQTSACEFVMSRHKEFDTPEAIHDYFETLLYLKGDAELDQKGILKLIEKEMYPFQTVSSKFMLIGNDMRSMYIPTPENQELLRAIRMGHANKLVYRKAGLYSINIYEFQYQKLKERNAIENVGNGICILSDNSLYTKETGLEMDMEQGIGLFL